MIWTSYTASGGSIEATSPTGETAVYHITLPDVLAFITGCPTVPPIGFQPEPSINFQNESPFPCANTCINAVYLPLQHKNSFDDFKYAVVFGILNAAGFGRV